MVSSLAAAGPRIDGGNNGPGHEQPVSEYGKSKLGAERALLDGAPDAWQLAIVRPPIVIGPRDPGMLELFKTIENRLLLLPGLLGRFKRYSFVGVGDLCNVLGNCIERELHRRPSIYFSAHPRETTILEISLIIRELLNQRWSLRAPVPMPLLWLASRLGKLLDRCGWPNAIPLTPDKVREAKQKGWVCDGQLAAQELDVDYQEDLRDILSRTCSDYQERGWLKR